MKTCFNCVFPILNEVYNSHTHMLYVYKMYTQMEGKVQHMLLLFFTLYFYLFFSSLFPFLYIYIIVCTQMIIIGLKTFVLLWFVFFIFIVISSGEQLYKIMNTCICTVKREEEEHKRKKNISSIHKQDQVALYMKSLCESYNATGFRDCIV